MEANGNEVIKEMKSQITFLLNEVKKMKDKEEDLLSKVDNLKMCLSYIEVSSIFDQSFQIFEFNKLNGEAQTKIITDIFNKNDNKNPDIIKVFQLLSYLSGESKKCIHQQDNSNYIYFPSGGIKEILLANSIRKNEVNKIAVTSMVTEMLYENNQLTSDTFINQIKNFSEFEIEIKYPSLNYDKIFSNIAHLKSQQIGNIFISILISDIEATDRTFKGNTDIDSVRFDSSVKVITGSNFCGSFQGCSSLKYVIIPPSVKTIGGYAFRECSSLKEIIIPSSVTEIGNFAFSRCTSLNKVSIPSSVKEIGSCCFSECSSLTDIYIPSSVSLIGKSVFSKCNSLKSVSIPSSVGLDSLQGISPNANVNKL